MLTKPLDKVVLLVALLLPLGIWLRLGGDEELSLHHRKRWSLAFGGGEAFRGRWKYAGHLVQD